MKRDWCCEMHSRGCPGAKAGSKPKDADVRKYDCSVDYKTWETTWPVQKKIWCCKHTSRGCSKLAPYDCAQGFQRWQTGWSVSKKKWCCKRYSRGCPGDPAA